MSFILGLIFLCAGASAVAAEYDCLSVAGKLKQIDAGAGEVYGVDDNGATFHLVGDSWQQLPGQFIHVTVGPAGVWAINRTNIVHKLQDNRWKSVTGFLQQVDAGFSKSVGGVGPNGYIYCLNENCVNSRSSLLTFTRIDGSLRYYSCGLFGCWGLSFDNRIFFRQNVASSACQGTGWQPIEGSLRVIEVGSDGSVYGINPAGDAFKRMNVTASNPTGTSWSQIDVCATFKHVTYDAGVLWLLSQNGDIYKCAENNDSADTKERVPV
ncbi:fish-egg lectin-like [Dendropsophus ebraccatus]|uniref:fish-egg lectin-like n=1 Tax=Dendropsophus ebraccatus TaxID=150705 RepID=UPI003831709E